MLSAGIVGLPNVGKSSLFNAIIRQPKAAAENYPFCTIEPNLGMVELPDSRLEALQKITGSPAVIPAGFEFVDIAGLVRGASRGEGLGNQFLAHIREVDAMVQVVRCFEDAEVPHLEGSLDPIRDVETVQTELVLADLESASRRQEKIQREIKRGDPEAVALGHLLERLIPHLDAGNPGVAFEPETTELVPFRQLQLLSAKPVLFVANLAENDLPDADSHPAFVHLKAYAARQKAASVIPLSARLESDLLELSPEESREFLRELGLVESGIAELIRATFRLLGLITFFTFNEKEVRAWPVPAGTLAPQAAGRIHTDFEHGFIKAEIVSWHDLQSCGSVAHAREQGRYRIEGKDYCVQDGDVILFRFHN